MFLLGVDIREHIILAEVRDLAESFVDFVLELPLFHGVVFHDLLQIHLLIQLILLLVVSLLLELLEDPLSILGLLMHPLLLQSVLVVVLDLEVIGHVLGAALEVGDLSLLLVRVNVVDFTGVDSDRVEEILLSLSDFLVMTLLVLDLFFLGLLDSLSLDQFLLLDFDFLFLVLLQVVLDELVPSVL